MEAGENQDTLVAQCNELLKGFLHEIVRTRDESCEEKKWRYCLVSTSTKVGEYLSKHNQDGSVDETNARTNLKLFRAHVVESIATNVGYFSAFQKFYSNLGVDFIWCNDWYWAWYEAEKAVDWWIYRKYGGEQYNQENW